MQRGRPHAASVPGVDAPRPCSLVEGCGGTWGGWALAVGVEQNSTTLSRTQLSQSRAPSLCHVTTFAAPPGAPAPVSTRTSTCCCVRCTRLLPPSKVRCRVGVEYFAVLRGPLRRRRQPLRRLQTGQLGLLLHWEWRAMLVLGEVVAWADDTWLERPPRCTPVADVADVDKSTLAHRLQTHRPWAAWRSMRSPAGSRVLTPV
jgi:hypothetical protein